MLSHPFFYRYNSLYFTLSVVLAASFTYLGLHKTAGMPAIPSLIDSVVSIVLLAVILIYVVNTLGFYHPVRYVFLILFSASVLITILYTVIMELLLPFIYEPFEMNLLMSRYFWPRFIYSWFTICGASIISWFHYRIKEMEKKLARQEEADRVAKEAELYKLRQQLQPHFLFNSLNSINALIGSQPDRARKMVFQLSDFFRGTLKRENGAEAAVGVCKVPRSMARDNRTLGRFHLSDIPPAPRGVPQIEVTFDIDANGILHVSAKDKGTGKEQKIRIEASSGLSDAEIERMKKEAEANAESDKQAKEAADKINSADQLIFQTEKQLKDYGDKIPADKKGDIEAALSELKAAFEKKDIPAIDAAVEKMNKAWEAASQDIYNAQQSNPEGGNTEANTGNGKTAEDVQDVDFEEVK